MHANRERGVLLTFRQEELPVVGKTVPNVRKVRTRNSGISVQPVSQVGAPLQRLNQGPCAETVRGLIPHDGQGQCEWA